MVGTKVVALFSLWLPVLLTITELLAIGGLDGWEYFFIALTWPAAMPLTAAIALLYRQAPFCAGVVAVVLSGVVASQFLWTGVLTVALGAGYWQSGPPDFADIAVGTGRVVVTAVVPSLPAWAMVGVIAWLRRIGRLG